MNRRLPRVHEDQIDVAQPGPGLEIARRDGVPPFVVASDRTLRDLAASRPENADQLLMVYGIGPTKVDRYGAGLLEVIRSH